MASFSWCVYVNVQNKRLDFVIKSFDLPLGTSLSNVLKNLPFALPTLTSVFNHIFFTSLRGPLQPRAIVTKVQPVACSYKYIFTGIQSHTLSISGRHQKRSISEQKMIWNYQTNEGFPCSRGSQACRVPSRMVWFLYIVGSLLLFSKNIRWHFLTQALKDNLLEFSRMFKQWKHHWNKSTIPKGALHILM